MYIQIFKGKELENEFEADDTYYAKIVEGLDKALTDLCVKAETITEKDIPRDFLYMYSPQDAIKKYVEKNIEPMIRILIYLKEDISNDLFKIRYDWITTTKLNVVFIKYCGFSLITQSFESYKNDIIIDSFYSCEELSKRYVNRLTVDNEGWYMP